MEINYGLVVLEMKVLPGQAHRTVKMACSLGTRSETSNDITAVIVMPLCDDLHIGDIVKLTISKPVKDVDS